MARPQGGYRRCRDCATGYVASEKACPKCQSPKREILPGASTIAKIAEDPGGLLHWAWQQGVEGRDYRETRDAAADAGTLAHEMIEAEWRGRPIHVPDTEIGQRATTGYEAFMEWFQGTRMEIVEMERPLVSQRGYGGTFDAIGRLDQRHELIDFKTGSSVRLGMKLQVAAYVELVKECMGLEMERAHICCFDRETGDFTHYMMAPETVVKAWQAFEHALAIHGLRKELK